MHLLKLVSGASPVAVSVNAAATRARPCGRPQLELRPVP